MNSKELPAELLAHRRVTAAGCWEWTRGRDSNGYGRVQWNGTKIRVHRLVAHLVHELDLTNRLEYARHRCDNPPCFNPDHIEPGTPRDNQQDAIRRGRRIKSQCKRGHPFGAEPFIPGHERLCRECSRARKRAWAARQRAKGIPHPSMRRANCPVCGFETSAGYVPSHIRRVHKSAVA